MAHYRIRPYKHPKLKYVVRSKLAGKWERKFFASKAEAETYVQQKETELLNEGKEGVNFPSWLRTMAQRQQDRLTPFGKTLNDAVDFYMVHLENTKKSVPLMQAVEEMIAGRQSSGVSKRYSYDLKLRLGRFTKDFPDRSVASVTTAEVDSWLSRLGLAPVTRNTFRRDLRTLFSFGVVREYCPTNPVARARKAKEVEGEVGILTVDETARLLQEACDATLPYFALGAFAGLRPAELQRLAWDEIDFESKLVQVKASKSKTARRRFVRLRPNLEKWLLPHRHKTGSVSPSNLRKLELETRSRARLETWPSNALRHGFASYHLAHFNNAAELALEMGHTNQQMIFDHYRQLVKPKDAALYWQIAPGNAAEKVVAFAAAS
jgi:integrase